MYILTLLADSKLHRAMNDIRKRYFPPQLNKLEAHITLFHALPESRLDGVVLPAIKDLVQTTSPFQLGATTPFKLKKGIAIGMPKDHGGNAARWVYQSFQRQWRDFLSPQDMSFQAHYTVMNKVDDRKKVDNAFAQLQSNWKPHFGTAEGVSLWKYNAGHWDLVEHHRFKAD